MPETRAATELLRALAHLAEPPGPAHAPLADALELPEPADRAGHEALFGFQLYPWASVYLGPEGMLGGEPLRRVEGFWRAVGRDVPTDPDHLASLLGLYASLAEEQAQLSERMDGHPIGGEAQGELVARSRRALLEEHLAAWVFAFLERVVELGGSFHRAWAGLLHEILEKEVALRGRIDRLPASLLEVPELPDPREAGAGAFLGGLLAPAVSGLILTRADLGRIAAEHGLGLRAGERRYALEHLLGQEAETVLGALAQEAERQAAAHRDRASRLGEGTGWAAPRAERTARMLRSLAGSVDLAVNATRGSRVP